MEEQPGPIALQVEIEQRFADVQVQVEGAIDELELRDAAVKQALKMAQQFIERRLAHGNVERRQTKFAGERTTTRRFDVNDAMRDVLVVVQIVGQHKLRELRQLRGNDF